MQRRRQVQALPVKRAGFREVGCAKGDLYDCNLIVADRVHGPDREANHVRGVRTCPQRLVRPPGTVGEEGVRSVGVVEVLVLNLITLAPCR